jgi:hypothetical protein
LAHHWVHRHAGHTDRLDTQIVWIRSQVGLVSSLGTHRQAGHTDRRSPKLSLTRSWETVWGNRDRPDTETGWTQRQAESRVKFDLKAV